MNLVRSCAFQSTLPMKGATRRPRGSGATNAVSIHAPNEGSDATFGMDVVDAKVSIHAPNEGSDAIIFINHNLRKVSIHAPNEGSDCADV